MNQEIIPPVAVEDIEAELSRDTFLRVSNKGGTQLHVVDGRKAPATMREIGRLREIAFRAAGGGTGKDCDIDEFDLMDPPCMQLIVWDPAEKLILGGYRYIYGRDIRTGSNGRPRIATSHIFDFSPEFIEKYLPYTIELGRSFVRMEYQSTRAGVKALYVLDNLWDGLGALTVLNPETRYLFGKVTMYPDYHSECRNMILYFLHKHFPDNDGLVRPIKSLDTRLDVDRMRALFTGSTFKEDYRILKHAVNQHGLNIPPLVNAYMNLSPTMKMFGTAINDEFGDVEESGIFLSIPEITEEKKQRHIETFDASAAIFKIS
ncbi:MAG: GNAT family N-acetyltransferase [Duncaniella sp.]|nr:GNAT family N-acetyltransferase [Duncaniella sp.]